MNRLKTKSIFLTIIHLFIFIHLCVAQEYSLQAEDVLNITVHEQPDLATRTRISADGNITFPLLGTVEAAGLTIRELENKLTAFLKEDYLVSPQVIVYIAEYSLKQVSVIGCVNNPGKYDMLHEKETTVLQAIAMAGGFTRVAAINGTRVLRTEDGEEKTIFVKIKDITQKGEKDKDIPLKPNDIVFVPESFF